MSQIFHFGLGSLRDLAAVLDRAGMGRIFLVAGKLSFRESGAEAVVRRAVSGREVTYFSDFEPNPHLNDIERGIESFRRGKCDGVLAVGGGSAIDVAKLVGLFSLQASRPVDMIRGEAAPERDAPPLIAVPTTSGSGSEATSFAVVYVGHTKYSVAHPSLLPAAAILDPALTYSLSPWVTAVTGLDALSQAIESIWSIRSTEESWTCAAEAVRLVMEHLREAVHRPQPHHRVAMSRAACLAGQAINISRTTAPHAISYTMTSRFAVPHGHAVALTLPEMIVFNSGVTEDCVMDSRGTGQVHRALALVNGLLGCENAEASARRIAELMEDVGLPTRLRAAGIHSRQDLELIIDNVNVERLGNNPRRVTREALAQMLENIA